MASPRPVKVIAVSSGKGGVGKTNVSVNLATQLAGMGRDVMLLDADLGLANVDVLLGLSPKRNLSHVIEGTATLEEILVAGPNGMRIVPAASGMQRMAELTQVEHAGLIRGFSELNHALDYLIVDTPAGISDGVMSFARAAREVMVVVCDEPSSITDAYALVKVLGSEHGVRRFYVVPNRVRTPAEGYSLFTKLARVCNKFLDLTIDYAGAIPEDRLMRNSVQRQTPISIAYPGSPAARAFAELAKRVDKWPLPTAAEGHLEFFVERLIQYGINPGGCAAMNGQVMYSQAQRQGNNDLIDEHAALVKRIAYHTVSRLPPSVQVEDLIQAGMIGLLEAARQYDVSQGASFRTYAGIRIRGAMLDEIRRLDWTPRSVHRKAREVAEAISEVERRTGRDAKDSEVAQVLGIGLDEYHQILQDAAASKVFSIDQGNPETGTVADVPADTPPPLACLQDEGFRMSLVASIAELPEREQLIMQLYYDEELNLKEIAAVLGVSESRVSQIHGRILLKLKAQMADWA